MTSEAVGWAEMAGSGTMGARSMTQGDAIILHQLYCSYYYNALWRSGMEPAGLSKTHTHAWITTHIQSSSIHPDMGHDAGERDMILASFIIPGALPTYRIPADAPEISSRHRWLGEMSLSGPKCHRNGHRARCRWEDRNVTWFNLRVQRVLEWRRPKRCSVLDSDARNTYMSRCWVWG